MNREGRCIIPFLKILNCAWLIFYEDTSSILLLLVSTSNWHLHQCGSEVEKVFPTPLRSSLYRGGLDSVASVFFPSTIPIPFLLLPFTPKPNTRRGKSHLLTVLSEEFLYKVALPELKISPIMYFVIHNSVVFSKILKFFVPF